MATDTKKELRNQVMYSVYVRSHTAEGTFNALREDLDRIKDLGVDIIWLMPIHPIGEAARKGSMGCPYANRDYRAVNPEYGTMEDFEALVQAIHARGMKCIIDVVYNHTSPDSVLVSEHPEWFYHKPDGSLGNRVADWSDIIDLDYNNPALWDYQIHTLREWARLVDGFRCDVGCMLPLEFWKRARREVAKVRPDCFWLCETVDPRFLLSNRSRGIDTLSDSEAMQAFDACYDYDVYHDFVGCLTGKNTLSAYAGSLNRQEFIYPDNYLKLRFLENHDQSRAHFLIPEENRLKSWLAFCYFQKGMTLLYAGQEVGDAHLPSLFEKDPVRWDSGLDLTGLMRRLYAIKQHPLFADSSYRVWAEHEDTLCATHTKNGRGLLGVFPVGGHTGLIPAPVPDGCYRDLIGGGTVEVHMGRMQTGPDPVVIEYNA